MKRTATNFTSTTAPHRATAPASLTAEPGRASAHEARLCDFVQLPADSAEACDLEGLWAAAQRDAHLAYASDRAGGLLAS